MKQIFWCVSIFCLYIVIEIVPFETEEYEFVKKIYAIEDEVIKQLLPDGVQQRCFVQVEKSYDCTIVKRYITLQAIKQLYENRQISEVEFPQTVRELHFLVSGQDSHVMRNNLAEKELIMFLEAVRGKKLSSADLPIIDKIVRQKYSK
jgi:hypothetical protein